MRFQLIHLISLTIGVARTSRPARYVESYFDSVKLQTVSLKLVNGFSSFQNLSAS